MRKIFKKIVTVVAAAAMMVGTIAGMPTTEANAATATTEINLYLSDVTGIEKVFLMFNDASGAAGNTNITCSASTAEIPGYGGAQGYILTNDSNNNKLYKITLSGDVKADQWCNMQFCFSGATATKAGAKVNLSTYSGSDQAMIDASGIFNDNSKVYLSVNMDNASSYPQLQASLSATDPTAITATQVAEKITAIGTVTYTAESLAKIEAAETAFASYTGSNSDISNYATLTAARERYNQLKAAAAGDLVIYTQNAQNWAKMNLYSWNGSTQFFGAWPGTAMTACTKNNGWFSAKFSISAPANIIFNDGDGKQTSDITDVTAGTYWYVINDDGTATVSTTAPAGWVDEAAANIEKVEDTTGNTTTAPSTGDTTPSTGDTTPVIPVVAAIALLGLAVVIMNTKKANR